MLLHHARGQENVEIGDRFEWWDESSWEVVDFVGHGMYSPSGIGGTAIVALRPIGDVPEHYLRHVEEDGTVRWCGDSVAAGLAQGRIK